MRVIEVTWNDAWSDGSQSYTADTVRAAHKPLVQTSVGYEVFTSDDGIMLAACIDAEGDMNRIMYIPMGMVKQVRRLRGK